MTSLQTFRKAYYDASTVASSNVRTLGLGGLAFIWLFRPEHGSFYDLPTWLYLPGLLFVLALFGDLLQTSYKAAAWGFFARYMEREGVGEEDELDAPLWMNWPALLFFWSKQVLLVAGYFALCLGLIWPKLYPFFCAVAVTKSAAG